MIPPELSAECEFAVAAFHELKTTREIGMAYGPIPWTAIDAYATRHGITDPDEFEEFVWMIRVMDDVYLEVAAKKGS